MALKATYGIRCSCGAAFTGDVYEYVFAEHDPELKDAILSGKFNRIPCPSCGQGLPIENRFLYRDEKNRLWVWVCKKGEEQKRDELVEELIEKNAFMECHFLDGKEGYRKFLVFGRDGLIELLLKEDVELKRSEGRSLRKNPGLRLITEGSQDPGYLFLRGRKINISMPLRFPETHRNLLVGTEGKKRWLKHYSSGLNIHNPFSSFLNKRIKGKWDKIREMEPLDGTKSEFDDFAESWAYSKVDVKGFKARYPQRRAFFDGLKKMNISRKLR
jgi:CpXC protein